MKCWIWKTDDKGTLCDKCIKADVCGMEGMYDPATTYCAYRVTDRLHGKWVVHDRPSLQYGCNICGALTNINSNFCPNCGAYMRPRILDEAVDGEGKDGNVKEGDEK